MQDRFTSDYFRRQYRPRVWRDRGAKPVLHRAWIRKLRSLAGFSSTYLEAGCGEGDLLLQAQRRFASSVGFDISADGLVRAMTLGCTNLACSSALRMPFKRGICDIVLALDVVEHLADPELFLREAHRVLRPHGLLAISTPNPESFGARQKQERWFGYRDETHVSVMGVNEWRRLIRSAGFEIVEDGTDTLWDPPYLPVVPAIVQWILFITLKHALNLVDVVFPWSWGENYLCFARRSAPRVACG